MTMREGQGSARAGLVRSGSVAPEPEPGPGSDPDARPGSDSDPGARRPILVVDDEPAVLALAVRSLRARGHDVRGAGSGREALLIIYGGGPTPAVLVADIDMPGMSGIELAARVAADRPGVAIVLMSANPAVLDKARTRPELVRGVIAKPLTAESVVDVVERLVTAGAESATAEG